MNLILTAGIKIVLPKYVTVFSSHAIAWITSRDISSLTLEDRNLLCLGGSGVNCSVFGT